MKRNERSVGRRFRANLELLEDRTLPSGGFQFQLSDPGRELAAFPLLQANFEAAGEILTELVGGVGVFETRISASRATACAGAAPAGSQLREMRDGLEIIEASTITEGRTGVDPNGALADILIALNPDCLVDYWFDPSGTARSGQLPADKTDFISLALHELMHGLGLTSLRIRTGQQYGLFGDSTRTTFDALTFFGAGGDPTILYFVGSLATAEYGGPVPLTSIGPAASNFTSNFFHVGNPPGKHGDNLILDLMNGVELQPGLRYAPSAIDLAILQDIGWNPQVSFALSASSGPEPNASPSIVVQLSRKSQYAVSVNYVVIGGRAIRGQDFNLTDGMLTFQPGETTKNIPLAIVNDALSEELDRIELELFGPANATLGALSSHAYIIHDDELLPHAMFPERPPGLILFDEKTSSIELTVILSEKSERTLTVDLESFCDERDYFLDVETVTFTPGQTSATFLIRIVDDTLVEFNESCGVRLSSKTARTGANSSVHFFLQDDDLPIVPDSPPPGLLGPAAGVFTHSREYYSVLVTNAYRDNLEREPDAGGLEYWVALLLQGQSRQLFEAQLLGSAEYVTNQRGGRSWIEGLYRDLLRRFADSEGTNYWLALLYAGFSSTDVAFGIASSRERAVVVVEEYFRILGRLRLPGEDFWVDALMLGARHDDVLAAFLASNEFYFGRGRGNTAAWTSSVYGNLLSRAPDLQEVNFWLHVFGQR